MADVRYWLGLLDQDLPDERFRDIQLLAGIGIPF
jgi:hypothetical protein